MLLDKYEFYDLHAVLTAIRFRSDAPYHLEIIRTVYGILSAPQKTNAIESGVVRAALREVKDIDNELYRWVYVDNVYTYGNKIIRDDLCYSLLTHAFLKLLTCAESKDWAHLGDLADAFHNVPILFADGCKNLKQAIRSQFRHYNKKYKANLWKELYALKKGAEI